MSETAVKSEVVNINEKQAPVKFSATKAAINKMASKWKEVPDVTTKEGYSLAQQAKRELTPMRTAITKEMTAQKEAAQTHIKNINAKGGELVSMIEAIEKPIYDAKKEQDESVARKAREESEKEERRVLAIEAAIEDIQELTEGLLGADLQTIEDRLTEADKKVISDAIYMEFTEQASQVLDNVKTQLTNAVKTAKSLAAQQKELDSQQKEIDKTQRKAKLQESISRIKMQPVDLIGGSIPDMQAIADKLTDINVVEQYGDLAGDARTAIDETKTKLQAMITQQIGIDNQQAEIDRQNNERKQREIDEQKAKDDEANVALFLARLPEDKKMRKFADSLVSMKLPDIENAHLLAVLRNSLESLSDIKTNIYEHTQD